MFDFDHVPNRRETDSLKWDVGANELPLWVADMDFPAAPAIQKALQDKLDQGIFGYTIVPDNWYEAIQGWWQRRHHVNFERDWISFCTGVVPALSSIVRRLTHPGEKVLIQAPVYNIFFNSIVNNGRVVEESPLDYADGTYSINWEDFEKKLANPQVSLFVLCNPHNPVGTIWDKETLARMGELCAKHHVVVVSDEIHCDITAPGTEYVPFIAASQACANNSVTLIAPSKAFNIAGIQSSAVVVPDPVMCWQVNRGLNNDEVAEGNVFACAVAEAAFTAGDEWLDEARAYLFDNRAYATEFLENHVPEVHAVEAQATYLLWIDCRAVAHDTTQLNAFLREKTGLVLSTGESYGAAGAGFLRMNLACTRETLQDALARFAHGIALACEQQR